MTDARWCNYGNHPFDGSRLDTALIGKMQQVPNQWGGQQPSTTPNIKEICGDCAAELGITLDYKAPDSPEERKSKLLKELKELDK
jgi:hypothetical protein